MSFLDFKIQTWILQTEIHNGLVLLGFKSLTDEDKKKLRKVLGLKKARKRAIDQTKDENKNGKIVKPSSEDVALKVG